MCGVSRVMGACRVLCVCGVWEHVECCVCVCVWSMGACRVLCVCGVWEHVECVEYGSM